MVVGVCRVVLRMPENRSLKDKRSVIRPALAQVQHRFAVSGAEIERQDDHHVGVLGFSCVSSDVTHADSVLTSVLRYFETSGLEAEVVDVQTELIHAL